MSVMKRSKHKGRPVTKTKGSEKTSFTRDKDQVGTSCVQHKQHNTESTSICSCKLGQSKDWAFSVSEKETSLTGFAICYICSRPELWRAQWESCICVSSEIASTFIDAEYIMIMRWSLSRTNKTLRITRNPNKKGRMLDLFSRGGLSFKEPTTTTFLPTAHHLKAYYLTTDKEVCNIMWMSSWRRTHHHQYVLWTKHKAKQNWHCFHKSAVLCKTRTTHFTSTSESLVSYIKSS